MQTETQYKRPPTIATMNRELVVLRRIFNIGVQQGWLNKARNEAIAKTEGAFVCYDCEGGDLTDIFRIDFLTFCLGIGTFGAAFIQWRRARNTASEYQLLHLRAANVSDISFTDAVPREDKPPLIFKFSFETDRTPARTLTRRILLSVLLCASSLATVAAGAWLVLVTSLLLATGGTVSYTTGNGVLMRRIPVFPADNWAMPMLVIYTVPAIVLTLSVRLTRYTLMKLRFVSYQ